MNKNKSRLCSVVPTNLYNRLCSDSINYGVSKSHIVSLALMEYYNRRGENTAAVKGLDALGSGM